MSFSKIASALVASALMISPIAAQAGTRASGSSVYQTSAFVGNRASAKVKNENSLAPLLLLVVAVVGGTVGYVAVDAITKTPGD